MIEVTDLEVRSLDLDHLDLYWKILDTDEDLERYSFFILRSTDGFGGPFEEIAGPFDNTFQFRDPNVQRLHKWRKYYYQIKVVHKDSGDETITDAQWLKAAPDRIAMELQRRFFLKLREFTGRKCLLFQRKTFGQRCPHCFVKGPRGNTTGRQTMQNCKTCYDTTYVGGYNNPIVVYVQFDPAPTMPQLTDTREQAPVLTSGRTGAFPPVSPRDMIVEAENRRWRVEGVPSTEKLRAKIHQELKVLELERPDIRYSIPIPADALADPSPPREFTRPMDIGA
jgi:hypothetical protein